MTSSITIVAGMHRSGTSLMASILQSAGIDMGRSLLPPDANNRLGYFEDVDVLSLHQQMLTAATTATAEGHHDWGWTVDETLDRDVLESFRPAARSLAAPRLAGSRSWGWKDPRHTVLLDFWEPLLPDARYILVYRYPWDVSDSMQRLGAPVFLQNPAWSWKIWSFYNRQLLAFRRLHRERTLLISTNALAGEAAAVSSLLQRFGVETSPESIARIVEAESLHATDGTDPLIALSAIVHPEELQLLRELDAEADLGATGRWNAAPTLPRNARPPASEPADVAVIIPCHNHGHFAVDAVASCERTFTTPYELLIVDDGSTDGETTGILDKLQTAGYAVLRQPNRGLAAARNEGIRRTAAPLVIPLDSDNRLRSGYQSAVALMTRGELAAHVVHGAREEFGLRKAVVPPFEMDVETILAGNRIDACAVMRRGLLERCGLFDERMPFQGWEDWDFWLSAIECGARFAVIEDVGFDYRVRPSSMASTLLDPAVGQTTQRYIVEKHRALYLEHLPALLMHAQQAERNAASRLEASARSERTAEANLRLAEGRAAELAEALRALAETTRTLERLRLENETLEQTVESLRTEAEQSSTRAETLERRARELDHELRRWQDRVSVMEKTTAWRMRRLLLRMRKGR